MKKIWYWDEKDVYAHSIHVLNEDRVVVATSDTVLGLLAPLTHAGKVELDRIKKRTDKPYIVLVRNSHQATLFSDEIKQEKLAPLLKACWPGPLTIIVKANSQVSSYITSATGALSLRVPNHGGLQKLLQSFEGLFSTSANITGESVPKTLKEVTPTIMDEVAMVIDDRIKKESKPSTIIDCTGSHIKLVREGMYSRKFLEQYIALE